MLNNQLQLNLISTKYPLNKNNKKEIINLSFIVLKCVTFYAFCFRLKHILLLIGLLISILQCSASCGRGFKSRKVSCVTRSGRPVPEEYCQHASSKPSERRRCRGGRCPKWKTGNWGEVGLSDPAIKHFSAICSHGARHVGFVSLS